LLLVYATLILEKGRSIYVIQSPLQLIKQACLDHYSTYQGRVEAVIYHTGFQSKVPIPIAPDNLYLFPTHAFYHYDCCWITHHHVYQIKKKNDKNAATILFNSEKTIELPVTPYSLRQQVKRKLSTLFNLDNL